MRLQAINSSLEHAPKYLLDLGWSIKSQVRVTPGKEYTAYAVSVWRGVAHALIIDDDDLPSFLPAWFFQQLDGRIPDDWICNVFHDDMAMIIGPAFIAGEAGTYEAMVELVPSQVSRFRDYVRETMAR